MTVIISELEVVVEKPSPEAVEALPATLAAQMQPSLTPLDIDALLRRRLEWAMRLRAS